MREVVTKEFLIAAIATTVSFILILLFIIMYIRKASSLKKFERYDQKKKMIEIEYMRNNLEMQLYDVSRKLEEAQNRWKDINHLIISSQNKNNLNDDLSIINFNFLKSFNIDIDNIKIDAEQVFVLTPFNSEFVDAFITVKEVCNDFKFRCIRGDEEFVSEDILPVILTQILKSRFIVANITGRNPNVMYELGIAHAFGKNVIIVAENFTDIPFDLNNKRIILFEDLNDLSAKLDSSIKDLLKNKSI